MKVLLSGLVVSLSILSSSVCYSEEKRPLIQPTPGMERLMKALATQEQKGSDTTIHSLGEAVRASQDGIFLVGYPNGQGHGTAWVVSKEHRLLVTNAHVADIFKPGKPLTGILNRTTKTYTIENIWYHPGLMRILRGSLPIRSMDPADGSTIVSSPDLAILQLSPGGDPLPYELPLASWDEIRDLFGKEIAMLGYPAYDTAQLPDPNQKPVASAHNGMIARLTDFMENPDVDESLQQMVQHTASSWSGFSGSPLFLPNGHVIAVHNSSHYRKNEVVTVALPHAIRIDAVKEMLVYHGLDKLVQMNTGTEAILVDRFKKPDPRSDNFRKAVALVDAALTQWKNGKPYAAIINCDDAIGLAPHYGPAYITKWRSLRGTFNYTQSEEILTNQYQTLAKYLELNPSDVRASIYFIETQYRYALLKDSALAANERDLSKYKKIIEVLQRVPTLPNIAPEIQAEALARIALIQENPLEDSNGALQSLNKAAALSPFSFEILKQRSEYYYRHDDNEQGLRDRQEARVLESEWMSIFQRDR